MHLEGRYCLTVGLYIYFYIPYRQNVTSNSNKNVWLNWPLQSVNHNYNPCTGKTDKFKPRDGSYLYTFWRLNLYGRRFLPRSQARIPDWNRGPVHTVPDEYENGGFTLKTHQMFSVYTTPEEFNEHQSFWFVFEENLAGKSHDYRNAIVFEKLRFQNVFHRHKNEKPVFSNSSGFKSA